MQIQTEKLIQHFELPYKSKADISLSYVNPPLGKIEDIKSVIFNDKCPLNEHHSFRNYHYITNNFDLKKRFRLTNMEDSSLKEKIQSYTKENISLFTKERIQSFSNEEISFFTPIQMTFFSSEQFLFFTRLQFMAFTVEQIGSITKDQIQASGEEQIIAFCTVLPWHYEWEIIHLLSGEQISWLTKEQIPHLYVDILNYQTIQLFTSEQWLLFTQEQREIIKTTFLRGWKERYNHVLFQKELE